MAKLLVPRFLFPVIILTLSSLASFGYVVLNLSPDRTLAVILFLVTFFLSLVFVLSLVFFFLQKKFFFKPKAFTAFGPLITDDDLRLLFRASFRCAVLIALLLATLLIFHRLW